MGREKPAASETFEVWRASFQTAVVDRFPTLAHLLAKPDGVQLLRAVWEVLQGAEAEEEICCPIHPLTLLVCPRCIASKGGAATAIKYTHEQLARWGRKGGRPRKKARKRKAAPATTP
jgi:hypothetical protein